MATNISVNVANFNCQGIINKIHYIDTFKIMTVILCLYVKHG